MDIPTGRHLNKIYEELAELRKRIQDLEDKTSNKQPDRVLHGYVGPIRS